MTLLRTIFLSMAIATGAVSALSSAATAATFSCKKDAHEIELLICKSKPLQKLDQQITKVFKQAVAATGKFADKGQARKLLQAEQRGWIKGRNDCWKADDKAACTTESYQQRITELQARYMLVKAQAPVFYTCNGNPADEFVVTAMASQTPSVRIERGDSTEVAILDGASGGTRFVGSFGVEATLKDQSGTFIWKDGATSTCVKRQ